VPSTVIDQSDPRAGNRQGRQLKALVFLPGIAYYRTLEGLLGALISSGHRVALALDRDRRQVPRDNADLLAEPLPRQSGPWRVAERGIRRSLDYLRYLEPDCADAEALREEARARAPRALRALLFLPPFRWAFGRRALTWVLRGVEAGIPRPRGVRSFLAGQAPDLVIVSPLVGFGSPQGDYVRAATAAGIPSVLVVADEDELTAKGVIQDVPTLTVTGSEAGRDELVRFHGIPRERVAAVGADPPSGLNAPADHSALEAVERASRMEVVSLRKGRLLRPMLWLLTPLLAALLLLFRPRATGRAAIKAARRLRTGRSKARARSAKERRLAGTNQLRQQKMERAKLKRQPRVKAARAEPPEAGTAEAELSADVARETDQSTG